MPTYKGRRACLATENRPGPQAGGLKLSSTSHAVVLGESDDGGCTLCRTLQLPPRRCATPYVGVVVARSRTRALAPAITCVLICLARPASKRPSRTAYVPPKGINSNHRERRVIAVVGRRGPGPSCRCHRKGSRAGPDASRPCPRNDPRGRGQASCACAARLRRLRFGPRSRAPTEGDG